MKKTHKNIAWRFHLVALFGGCLFTVPPRVCNRTEPEVIKLVLTILGKRDTGAIV